MSTERGLFWSIIADFCLESRLDEQNLTETSVGPQKGKLPLQVATLQTEGHDVDHRPHQSSHFDLYHAILVSLRYPVDSDYL